MQQFGLIGKKLAHSFSPTYFNKKFEKEDIDARYDIFELAHIEAFRNLVSEQPMLTGLNVTIPYKQAVIPMLNELDPTAEALGAVNTIAFREDGTLKGYNTDVIGFEQALNQALKHQSLEQAIVLGTGGSSKAVLFVLKKKLGVKHPILVSRTPKNGAIGYEDLHMLQPGDFDLVVNTTPLGMYPHVDEAPPFPYACVTEKHLAYDLVYNPLKTRFLQLAEDRGARIEGGLGMLHGQAIASWNIWQSYARPHH